MTALGYFDFLWLSAFFSSFQCPHNFTQCSAFDNFILKMTDRETRTMEVGSSSL
jgi:hypothetical protein